MNFTRTINLTPNRQVLLYLDYEEDYCLFVMTKIEGATARISMTFDTEEKAENALENYSIEMANTFWNTMNDMLNPKSND